MKLKVIASKKLFRIEMSKIDAVGPLKRSKRNSDLKALFMVLRIINVKHVGQGWFRRVASVNSLFRNVNRVSVHCQREVRTIKGRFLHLISRS